MPCSRYVRLYLLHSVDYTLLCFARLPCSSQKLHYKAVFDFTHNTLGSIWDPPLHLRFWPYAFR